METHLSCIKALNSARILSYLVEGSSMVNTMSSSNQPRISLGIFHVRSKISFFTLIWGPSLLPVTNGDGKYLILHLKDFLLAF